MDCCVQSTLKTPYAANVLQEDTRRAIHDVFLISVFITLVLDVPGISYIWYEAQMTSILEPLVLTGAEADVVNSIANALRTDFIGLQANIIPRLYGVCADIAS